MKDNEIGMGLTGFLLSLTTIMVLIKGNILTAKEVDAIIHDSRQYLNGPAALVGSPDILHAAEEALQAAERVLRQVLPPSA